MTRNWNRKLLVTLGLLAAIAAAGALPSPARAAGSPPQGAKTGSAASAADPGMALSGDKDGTVFGSLTVEEENRIKVEFERPELRIDIDPQQAPGLEWGTVVNVLDRSLPDFAAPMLAGSRGQLTPYLPRPYLERFGAGPVARFRPALNGVESWRLLVADSRGEEVAVFSGKGDPPKEIPWDGRTAAGETARPGLTYSHVLEAQDRAGNRRKFVGEGFQVPPYRVQDDSGLQLLISGRELRGSGAAGGPGGRACLLEAASRLGLACRPGDPVTIQVTARSFEEASALGREIEVALLDLLPGGPARLNVQAQVETGAPEGGTVLLAGSRAP